MAVSSAIRKAAILVSCLDRAQADALLDGMSEEQARQVRRAMVELDEVESDERDDVIQEFVHRGGRRPESRTRRPDDGVELAGGLAERIARGADASVPLLSASATNSDPARRPFDFLLQADGDRLAAFLRDERPQTVALVLSYLSADQSARIAAALPQPQQAEVLRRLADLDEAAPEILREVEHALRERIQRDERNRERRGAGLEIVARILDAAGPRLAKEWQSAIDDQVNTAAPAPELSSIVASVTPPLAWHEFERWEPRRALAAVLATLPEVSVLALAGATPGFFQRLTEVMHPDDAKFYRRATSQLSPTRLADIDLAQEQLAARAGQSLATLPFPSTPALVRAA